MKTIIPLLMAAALAFTGCQGAGERTGQSVDHGAAKVKEGAQKTGQTVGHGMEKAGQKLENASN